MSDSGSQVESTSLFEEDKQAAFVGGGGRKGSDLLGDSEDGTGSLDYHYGDGGGDGGNAATEDSEELQSYQERLDSQNEEFDTTASITNNQPLSSP